MQIEEAGHAKIAPSSGGILDVRRVSVLTEALTRDAGDRNRTSPYRLHG